MARDFNVYHLFIFSPILKTSGLFIGWVEWGFYAMSASKAIFRARTYNGLFILFILFIFYILLV